MSRDNGARADRWVAPFFKRYWKALALALFLGVATFGFASGLMVTSGFLISAAAALPGSILMIHLPTLFVRIFGIGKPILQGAPPVPHGSGQWRNRLIQYKIRLFFIQKIELRRIPALAYPLLTAWFFPCETPFPQAPYSSVLSACSSLWAGCISSTAVGKPPC